MFSIFPELLTYYLFGIFILRITAGALFIKYGFVKIFTKPKKLWKTIGFIELLCGVFLLVGFLTQLAAFLIFLIMLGAIVVKIKTKNEVLQSPYDFYILLLAISLSLLFLGPGIFSIDLPL